MLINDIQPIFDLIKLGGVLGTCRVTECPIGVRGGVEGVVTSPHLLLGEVLLNQIFLGLKTKLAEDDGELLAESASLRLFSIVDHVQIFDNNLSI